MIRITYATTTTILRELIHSSVKPTEKEVTCVIWNRGTWRGMLILRKMRKNENL